MFTGVRLRATEPNLMAAVVWLVDDGPDVMAICEMDLLMLVKKRQRT